MGAGKADSLVSSNSHLSDQASPTCYCQGCGGCCILSQKRMGYKQLLSSFEDVRGLLPVWRSFLPAVADVRNSKNCGGTLNLGSSC
jgi:hypothetical protein